MKVFSSKRFVLFICICLIADSAKGKTTYKISPVHCAMVGAAGAITSPLWAPAAAAAAGFGAGGIGAGTLAAKMMSWTAYVYGGGVPAGSLVAYLQSLGAAGLTSYATTAAGSVLVAAGCLYLDKK